MKNQTYFPKGPSYIAANIFNSLLFLLIVTALVSGIFGKQWQYYIAGSCFAFFSLLMVINFLVYRIKMTTTNVSSTKTYSIFRKYSRPKVIVNFSDIADCKVSYERYYRTGAFYLDFKMKNRRRLKIHVSPFSKKQVDQLLSEIKERMCQ